MNVLARRGFFFPVRPSRSQEKASGAFVIICGGQVVLLEGEDRIQAHTGNHGAIGESHTYQTDLLSEDDVNRKRQDGQGDQ